MRLAQLAALFALAALTTAAVQVGASFILDKPTAVPTCAAALEGAMIRQAGGTSGAVTKVCVCRSDGAGTPAYQWCSLAMSAVATVSCAGGSPTVCP